MTNINTERSMHYEIQPAAAIHKPTDDLDPATTVLYPVLGLVAIPPMILEKYLLNLTIP